MNIRCKVARGVAAFALLTGAWILNAASPDHPPSELIGVWRGTSLCSDREASPRCKDEVVVYEFSPGSEPGSVRWKADKIVDGERLPMGELDLTWNGDDASWRAEFKNASVHLVWRLTVEGKELKGTGTLLPGNETVRKIAARKE